MIEREMQDSATDGDRLSASLEYCSVSCNSTVGCISWAHPTGGQNTGASKKSTVFYGARNAIVEFDFEAAGNRGGTRGVHLGHTDDITSVRCSPENTLLSTSRDGSCRLWQNGRMLTEMKAGAALMCGDLAVWNQLHWVAAGSTDDTVHIWAVKTDSGGCSVRSVASLRRGKAHTPLCVRFYSDKVRQKLLLFVGWTSCELTLFEMDETSGNEEANFREVCVLDGHKDWVRDIDVRCIGSSNGSGVEDEILVATCGQDCLIRVWRISPLQPLNPDEMQVRKIAFKIGGTELQAELETVLEGHTGWVHSVRWRPGEELRLLSASMDKSIIVWSPVRKEEGDIWVERHRLGNVGGNNLGFMGATWNASDGNQILAYGFHGSFHLWESSSDSDGWTPAAVPGGHFGHVTDLSWSPRGSHLLSCSADQTTRLHGTWEKPVDDKEKQLTSYGHSVWRELARPQVHGHDLFCIAAVSETSFISGADEKVLRYFSATRNFVANFERISGHDLTDGLSGSSLPEGACVAALGLSNKAVFQTDAKVETADQPELHPQDSQEDFHFRPVDLTAPPLEETLAQNTLFHEVRKLYGHGYEVFACAASPDGSLVASSCKAQSAKHATVLLWDTSTWNICQRLEFHQLTVTCLAFSEDSQYLLSVSRDRTWALWQKQKSAGDLRSNSFVKVGHAEKATNVHQRIIWGCTFAPANFGKTSESTSSAVFATCSRDKKVVVWRNSQNPRENPAQEELSTKGNWRADLILEADDSARCVVFSRSAISSPNGDLSILLAVGLDSGRIQLKLIQNAVAADNLRVIGSVNVDAHGSSVNRVSFRPTETEDSAKTQKLVENAIHSIELLASCSDDHSVKLHRITAKI